MIFILLSLKSVKLFFCVFRISWTCFLTYTFLHRWLATLMVMMRVFLLDYHFEVKKTEDIFAKFPKYFKLLSTYMAKNDFAQRIRSCFSTSFKFSRISYSLYQMQNTCSAKGKVLWRQFSLRRMDMKSLFEIFEKSRSQQERTV